MSATRPSSSAGLSSQGTLLLALTGTVLAVVLVLVLPRMGASRAAGSRTAQPAVQEQPEERSGPAELAKPAELEPDAVAQVESAVPVGTLVVHEGPAVEEKAKMEGPPLRHLKAGGGKRDTAAHDKLKAENRERRKARRERAASGEQDFVQDGATAEADRPKTVDNPGRKRVSNRGGNGRGQGQGKGKTKG
jgi:hypothetical protein